MVRVFQRALTIVIHTVITVAISSSAMIRASIVVMVIAPISVVARSPDAPPKGCCQQK